MGNKQSTQTAENFVETTMSTTIENTLVTQNSTTQQTVNLAKQGISVNCILVSGGEFNITNDSDARITVVNNVSNETTTQMQNDIVNDLMTQIEDKFKSTQATSISDLADLGGSSSNQEILNQVRQQIGTTVRNTVTTTNINNQITSNAINQKITVGGEGNVDCSNCPEFDLEETKSDGTKVNIKTKACAQFIDASTNIANISTASIIAKQIAKNTTGNVLKNDTTNKVITAILNELASKQQGMFAQMLDNLMSSFQGGNIGMVIGIVVGVVVLAVVGFLIFKLMGSKQEPMDGYYSQPVLQSLPQPVSTPVGSTGSL